MNRILNRRTLPIVSKLIGLGILFFLMYLVVRTFMWSAQFMHTTGITPIMLTRLVADGGAPLESSGGRTNILVLGMSGGNHEGSDLTDTIMVLSLNNVKKTMSLISVPRDIWSDTLKDKINTAYHYGELKKKGGGLLLSKVIVEDVLGIPVHYAVVIDFSGFTKVIDEVGGIDVNVPDSFTDTQYPIDSMENATCSDGKDTCHYETIHFVSGWQHMDGATALKYARSRHAEGTEGSDFARSRRQQIIMIALKDGMVHPLKWFTPARVGKLPDVIDDATDMDMNIAQVMTIGKRFIGAQERDIQKISFDDRLDVPPQYLYGDRYVLVPHESWDDIHTYVKSQLEK